MRFLLILLTLFVLAACSSEPSDEEVEVGFAALPQGNAERGAAVYTLVDDFPPCTSCHALEGRSVNGPALAGYSAVAGTRVQGQSAEEYTYIAIVQPGDHIVEGYPNIMPTVYQERLTPQEMADLIAYLLTL
jgi:mono/diheme cytochrome c family protein